MFLHSLKVAGYRSFGVIGEFDEKPLQHLQLAPLTLLLGKNNSGKSNIAQLIRRLLFTLHADTEASFLRVPTLEVKRFEELVHLNSVHDAIQLELEAELDGKPSSLKLNFRLHGNVSHNLYACTGTLDDQAFDSRHVSTDVNVSLRQVLSKTTRGESWIRRTQAIFDALQYVGPVRAPIHKSYGARLVRDSTEERLIWRLIEEPELLESVSEWTAKHLEGAELYVRKQLDSYQLMFRQNNKSFELAHAGQGLHQLMPILALCFGRQHDQGREPFIDIIEQPELHLHDAAHPPLGELLVNTVKGGRGQLIVETHSEGLLLRIQRLLAEGALKPEQVSVIYVSREQEETQLQSIPFDENGTPKWWPPGIFIERFEEVKAIHRAQRRRS